MVYHWTRPRFWRISVLLLLFVGALISMAALVRAETMPTAIVVNDEGGPVSITGQVNYTNPFFTLGVAAPMVILEDQAGFVDRNENFLLPVESQTLGQITSDFYTSPFSYSLALPAEPQGTYRDVDNDGLQESGVQIYAIAYWTNTFGDPYLEERDLFGGGWSTAYASTRVSNQIDKKREVVGGKFLVYAPDDQQGFPAGFGADGLLFTADDPVVIIPQGYTIVDLDTQPFTFDRSRHPIVDLIEPQTSALVDFSALSYAEAFDQLVELLRREYAFTEYKGIDWDDLHSTFMPRFEEAEKRQDRLRYRRALRDFAWSIPDGHVSGPFVETDFGRAVVGGLGLAIRELDDGRVVVNFVTEQGPADRAGIELGAEILAFDGEAIAQVIDRTVAYSAPFSTDHVERLEKLHYATRFPIGTEIAVTYRNGDDIDSERAVLRAVPELESFQFAALYNGVTGFELPLTYELLPDSGYAYAKIYSFSDNNLLSVQLWERMIRLLNEQGVPGLIIDMRQNSGGSGFLADQMAAYFFDEPHVLGNTGRYDEEQGQFYFDPRGEERFYLPAEDLRYRGEVVVLVGPNCNSACEFFSYDMTIADRAAIVGHYPTAGLGGSINRLLMPEDEYFTYTTGRSVDANGEIHIEGKGVAPDIRVPVTEETLFGDGDPVLAAAINHLKAVE